jgi:acetylornithine deacetylase/succinyl-diaminopimelate desuccinylase-like protein
VRPATEVERRRLNESFAALCAIPSPFGRERAVADHVAGELRALGLEVAEDGTATDTGAQAGNLLARLAGRDPGRSVLLCAHLDTVPHDGVVEPVLVDDGWESAGDTILGADNKAAVAVLLALARRAVVDGLPVGVELLFTVSEENALAGAKAVVAALAVRLRLRPREPDRRDRRRLADLLPARGALPRSRRARRHPTGGRAQRDRRGRPRGHLDAPRARR